MPELPEVETIAKGLRKALIGKKIKGVQATFPGIVKENFRIFKSTIIKKQIKGVRRRGKYLLIDLSAGKNRTVRTGGKTILVHLGMTGGFRFVRSLRSFPKASVRSLSQAGIHSKHDHLIFRFFGSEAELRYNDQRKFGKIKAFHTIDEEDVPELKKLGPETLEVSSSEFISIFKRRKGRIKSALLNQQIIAGLGNIYGDESLFEANIHPSQKVNLLKASKLKDLHRAIRQVLNKAIKAGGSSIENYLDVDGRMGRFQLHHKVYGREGESCKRCRTKIKRIRINQRSSYFCPRCQPEKR